MNIHLLVSTTIIASCGFIIAFYGILAKSIIENEVTKTIGNGTDSYSDFMKVSERWTSGSFFMSKNAPVWGFIIVINAIVFNFMMNYWWSCIIVLVVGFIMYIILSKILKSKVQMLSILLGLLAYFYSIFLIAIK